MAVASLLLGFVLTVVGVALVSVPAALIVAGLALIAAGVDMTRPTPPTGFLSVDESSTARGPRGG